MGRLCPEICHSGGSESLEDRGHRVGREACQQPAQVDRMHSSKPGKKRQKKRRRKEGKEGKEGRKGGGKKKDREGRREKEKSRIFV